MRGFRQSGMKKVRKKLTARDQKIKEIGSNTRRRKIELMEQEQGPELSSKDPFRCTTFPYEGSSFPRR